VIAVRNAFQLLQVRLDSWLEGLPPDVELIVVDGGSTDGSREWLEANQASGHQGSLTVMAKDDSSIAEAWNNAVAVARGEWVLFMGADDRIPGGGRWHGILDRLDQCGASVDACLFPVEIVSPAGRLIDAVSPNLVWAGRGRERRAAARAVRRDA